MWIKDQEGRLINSDHICAIKIVEWGIPGGDEERVYRIKALMNNNIETTIYKGDKYKVEDVYWKLSVGLSNVFMIGG